MEPVIRERWFDLSLPEQMVNIGNEVKRAVRFDEDNQKKRAFIKKALEYIELTMDDPKNKTVIPEIKIGKEILEEDSYSRNKDWQRDPGGLHGGSCIELYQRADKGLLSEFYISFVK